jgi:hypothetical protein
MAQADIVNLSTKPDGTFNWGAAMRGAMGTIAAADLETLGRLTGRMVAGGGEAVFDRSAPTGNVATIGSSGALMLMGFTAARSESIGKIRVFTATTAAGATPTLCRLGIYREESDGGVTLLHSTANDTALFAAANTTYTVNLTSSFSKVAGVHYMVGLLVVSSATLPTFVGPVFQASAGYTADLLAGRPRVVGNKNGETDLPASLISSQVGGSHRSFQAVLLP